LASLQQSSELLSHFIAYSTPFQFFTNISYIHDIANPAIFPLNNHYIWDLTCPKWRLR
jgi:hypothetical protein